MCAVDRSTSITSSQIRKHTLQQDDINPASLVWQEPVIDKDLTTPPGGESEGDRYLVASLIWDLLDEDCSDISDWDDEDTDTGVSEVDPVSQFRFDTNSGAAGDANAQRSRDIGNIPNIFTIEINLYHDAIGTKDADDRFLLNIEQTDEQIYILFASDGLFIKDTDSGDTEVGTNLVKIAEWQRWRFLVTFGDVGDGVCDVYLDDNTHDWEKVGTAIPCSFEGVGTNGKVLFNQGGSTTDDMVTHVNYINIGTGLHTPEWYQKYNKIAQYINSSWSFYTPQEGWFVWVKDEDKLYRFDGSSWAEFAGGGGMSEIVEDTTPQLGGDLDMNGKNIDFPTTPDISDCLDEDNMVSDSATKLATQQSIKKYVDDNIDIVDKSTIGITIDGGGVELTTGYKGFIRVPWNCTITKATLLSDISGNIIIDLWKCSYADYDAGSTHPVDGDSITASAPPTLSGATKSEDNTLTAWTTSITAGDIIAFNIDSITDITKTTLILEVTKT